MDMTELCSQVGPAKKRKRVGRGSGSGHGKTSGRGHKGAHSRSGWRERWATEGGQMPLFRRLPKKGFTNGPFRRRYDIINVGQLARFEAGTAVDLALLEKEGVLKSRHGKLKILGEGELTVSLSVKASKCSKTAQEKIEKAGGTLVLE